MKYILLDNWIINIEQIAYIKIEGYDDTATIVMSNNASYKTRTHIKDILDFIKNAKPVEEIIEEME